MPVSSKALARGAFALTAATPLYTVPASTSAVVTNIAITNTTSTAGTFTLTLAGTALHTATAIAGNSTIYIDCKQVLATTNTITGLASATTINYHISGVEIT